MTHALTIARRELADRTMVFTAAAITAVLPFVLAAIPAVRGSWTPAAVITTVGGILAIGFTLGLALILGLTMIGRDLSEKRLSFYFSRPIGASEIWFGKLAAAFLTCAIVFTITYVPTYLASADAWRASWNVNLSALVAVCGLAALVFLVGGHAAGTMFRSRSPIIAIDLVCFIVAALAVMAIGRSLLNGFAVDLTIYFGCTLFFALVAIFVSAGAWQLAHGRVDRRRNHIELSRFLWTSIAVVLLVAVAWSVWVTHPSFADVNARRAPQQPASGSWMAITGTAKHRADYQAMFLYDLARGEAVRVPGMSAWWGGAFTRDGRHAAYVRVDEALRGMRGELCIVPLQNAAKTIETGLQLGAYDTFVLNDDASRVAMVSGDGNLSVYDVASRRMTGAVHLPDSTRGSGVRMFFLSPDALRVYVSSERAIAKPGERRSITVYEVDVANHRIAQTGRYDSTAWTMGFIVSADGKRAIVTEAVKDARQVTAVDARTLQPGAKMQGGVLRTMPLSSGDVAAMSNEGVLNIYAADGTPKRQVMLGNLTNAVLCAELTGNRLVVGAIDAATRKPVSELIDVSSGTVVRRDDGVRANSDAVNVWYSSDPRNVVVDAQRPTIARDGEKNFVLWQPLTGATKRIS